ncbi:ribonuclease H2 subunit A like protein [Babesia gibsoni]|uniref:Ribonuclease n=1 Tax=Babesia gibsoni TaxID=33632 RepID=A0AAD8LGC8_BABGI|nr:ribonuclease H2 subunit A like protein [Babesia gibsoni]
MSDKALRCFRLSRSGIPDRKRPLMLGIDEAGRGPVLGPMVFGGFVCAMDEHAEKVLKAEIGVNDSKKLTANKRYSMFLQLNEPQREFAICAEILTPRFISYNMLRRDACNLNQLSHNAAISIIKHFTSRGYNVKQVYLDAVGPCDKYEAKLKAIFPGVNFTAASKADSKYTAVSAASIVAKVIRDDIIEAWFKDSEEPVQIGSGYPGDPVTKNLLSSTIDKTFGFSEIVRYSWATTKNILDDSSKVTPFDWYDPDENEDDDVRHRRRKMLEDTQLAPFRTIKRIREL